MLVALAAALALPAALFASDAKGNHTKGPKPFVLTGGEEMKLSDYLVTGKTTVFDFFSEYCPPCRAIAPHMEKLHETRDDIAVVKVDINRPDVRGIDWKSPVAQQYGLESIPYFKIFGPDGKLKAEGDPAYDIVNGWLGLNN
ncbi:MAG TPA: thioredoxin family protein [Opitutaceae bacterium]|nr:thioredoxin family protein [Opitutaceae bacterium]